MNKNKILKITGQIFTVLCVGFIAYRLATFDIDYTLLFNWQVGISVVACALLLMLPIIINTINFKRILTILGGKAIKTEEVVDVYVTSNIGKYLPGNVMHFVGRNVLGSKYQVPGKNLALSTFFEVGLKVITALLMVLMTAYNYLNVVLYSGTSRYFIYVIVAIVVLVIGTAIVFYIKTKDRLESQNLVKDIAVIFVGNAAIFIINVLVFIWIAYVLVPDFTVITDNFAVMGGMYITAWLVGYLTPGAPGGIGVKEAVMVLLMAGILDKPSILLVALVVRVAAILADFLAFLVNIVYKRLKRV